MDPLLRDALDRTLHLMRDDLVDKVDDATLMAALMATDVVLVGDRRNLASHAAQCAFITAALQMARSGQRVYLAAPDVPLVGPQPPLKGERLISALLEVGKDLLPDPGFSVYAPRQEAALSISFGDSPVRFRARRSIAVNASAWTARLDSVSRIGRWGEERWPCGALGVGGLAAVEAFKASMQQLRPFAKDPTLFDQLFAFADRVTLDLAPANTPQVRELGRVDFVSGGAITNAALYVLARLLDVRGNGRIVEPEAADLSNLNRYSLLRRSDVDKPKAEFAKFLMPPRFELEAIPIRYEGGLMAELGEFAPSVLVGVDHIPTRWKVQAQNPRWLGIGATSHWASMASYHERGLGCARCLHPRDEPGNGPIPTIAFVSFFAGLELACYFLRAKAGTGVPVAEQYTYFSPLRVERIWRSPVAIRAACPTCLPDAGVRAA